MKKEQYRILKAQLMARLASGMLAIPDSRVPDYEIVEAVDEIADNILATCELTVDDPMDDV